MLTQEGKRSRICVRLGYKIFYVKDVEEVAPTDFQNLTRTGDDGLMGLDYSRLVCVLWTCVRELRADVAALKAAKPVTRSMKRKV